MPPPDRLDSVPGVPHIGSVAMAGPVMKPKLAREPFLLWRVPR
jgi:hypothetical protein